MYLYVVLSALQVVVEDDCCGNLVDNGFVAACHLFHAAVDHGAVGYGRGEALVEKYDFHAGEGFAQLSDAGAYVAHRVRLLAAQGGGVTHDDGVDRFARHIILMKSTSFGVSTVVSPEATMRNVSVTAMPQRRRP